MTLLSFVIFTICLAKQCTTMEIGIDTKTIQNRGMHTYSHSKHSAPIYRKIIMNLSICHFIEKLT